MSWLLPGRFGSLGNHTEAGQAASYLGRHHKFVLSQLTATHGGNQGSTRSDTYSYGGQRHLLPQLAGIPPRPGHPLPRNLHIPYWSTGLSQSDGTSWSDAATAQRVYEYAVEPAVLQNLPDHALPVTARGTRGPQLQAVECDPAIAGLPGVSAQLAVPLPRTGQVDASRPAPAAPHQSRTSIAPEAARPPRWPHAGRMDQAELPDAPTWWK